MPESVTDRPTKSHEYLFLLTKSASYFYDAEAIKEKSVTDPHAAGYTSGEEYAIGPMSRNGHSQREGDQSRVWGKTKAFDSSQGGGGTSFVGHSGNTKANGEPIFTGARNKRSVWTVTTAPYPDAHFATYPPDLIKPCIMAGTSSKGCCSACGAPWERIVERTPMVIDRSDRTHELGHTRSSRTMLEPNHSETLGWQPTCKCEAGIEPCAVLDCFGGSGTTGMVALELGRKAILIELNPSYCDLIRQRTDVTPGLQLA